ncbi:hypothetical protein EVAR_99722_1 [Eumeta japonica]|uniref:Uncharacterized protein n=1 Tax=Eumeta variegata TaxID=151549 RepID=A0A4C1ZMP1_EUMVA|nr:hypothetical protein EVAR_99722_1 [Eumeta japonica]
MYSLQILNAATNETKTRRTRLVKCLGISMLLHGAHVSPPLGLRARIHAARARQVASPARGPFVRPK